ncbi:MAG: ATP-binding cassette domain-containing protein, partial [Pseudomonadota bacterium]
MEKRVTSSMLYLDDVHVAFDGFKAINGLSMTLEPGEMRAIIGPNGAGKTTMMDIITGKTAPDQGTVLFDGSKDLTTFDESAIATMGIGRKFQKPTVFESHTLEDNLLLAMSGHRTIWTMLKDPGGKVEAERMDEIFDIIRLGHRRHDSAADLSHGQKQWLEIG